MSRGKGNLCWNMVFYGKHLASKKHTNPFHAFYLTGGNCGERHLPLERMFYWCREGVEWHHLNFLEQWPFSHNCLGFCSLCTGAMRLAGIWRYPPGCQEKAVPGEWVVRRSQQNADGPWLVFCLSGGERWYLVLACSMLETCNLSGKCLSAEQGSSLSAFEVLEVVTHTDRREPKSGTLGKGWKLAGLESGWRTEIKQDPITNNFPHYSLSSPNQAGALHQGESWFSCSSPAASLKFLCLLCFTAFLPLSMTLASPGAAWSSFPPSLGFLLFRGVMGPTLGVQAQRDLQELSMTNLGRVFLQIQPFSSLKVVQTRTPHRLRVWKKLDACRWRCWKSLTQQNAAQISSAWRQSFSQIPLTVISKITQFISFKRG